MGGLRWWRAALRARDFKGVGGLHLRGFTRSVKPVSIFGLRAAAIRFEPGFRQKAPFCTKSIRASSARSKSRPRMENVEAMLSIAARLHATIWIGCTPYFLDSSETIISSRIASNATLALKSGEWLFHLVILNRLSDKSIHLRYWPEFPRTPLRARVALHRPPGRSALLRPHRSSSTLCAAGIWTVSRTSPATTA